jgi:integrase
MAPDRTTWSGRRDQVWLLLAVQTGLRLSELTGLDWEDVQFGAGAHVHVIGKGRKERCTPMTKQTAAVMQEWLKEPTRGDGQIVFPNRHGGRMSSDGIQYRRQLADIALQLLDFTRHNTPPWRRLCPAHKITDRLKKVSPHVLRHTSAMDRLQSGVDVTVIALWLGHESIETTHVYLEADLDMKRNMLAKTTAHDASPGRYKPADTLLAFLKGL